MFEDWKDIFKKGWKSGRRCSRWAGGVEGGVQEALQKLKVFKKCRRGGSICFISARGAK